MALPRDQLGAAEHPHSTQRLQLGKTYLDNEVEYPFHQFQISQSLGRVVGFLDETSTFNIVLLDPKHNIQPTKSYDYKVTPCEPLGSQLTSLLLNIEALKRTASCSAECATLAGLSKLQEENHPPMAVLIGLSEGHHTDAQDLVRDGKLRQWRPSSNRAWSRSPSRVATGNSQ